MDPDWDEYKDGVAGKKGYVFGTEYQLFDGTNDIGKKGFGDWDVPCSVCRTEGASSTLMIPGKTKCSDSWKREYSGYLMSGHANHVAATQYICVDRDFEKVPGSSANKNGALLYPIEARCGSLPCKPYVEGRELTCVVCSK
ncbi:hypothetical protein FSP39_020730 [Pinctada imbricata]|uniref:Short-chain collagen C4-like n=1 Tax=Pinctada imbricata TaxID=66713 RepID=A0AA88YNJ2_PINIB|nr:hypothetical protein FSP39_020730 [Pinctada imbricata]